MHRLLGVLCAFTVPLGLFTPAAHSVTTESSAINASTLEPAGAYALDRTITDTRIRESSGLCASNFDPELLWTHNDSGDTNRIFGVTQSGTTKATLTLRGATARDWEDISAGPSNTLWVGDIGDNAKLRAAIQVYRIAEPRWAVTDTVRATKYTFVYPNGARNSETLMVNPVSGRLYIVSKDTDGNRGAIYRAPRTLSTTSANTLIRVGSAPGRITAGDFAPDGKTFMLRTQIRAYRYSSVTATPVQIPLPAMQQGESLAYGKDGSTVYFGSEGANSPVHRMSTGTGTEQAPVPETVSVGWIPVAPVPPANGVVRPESYGAKGDGVSDDAAALQRAVDDAAAKGMKVELGAKTYLLRSSLLLRSHSYLYGAGRASVLQFTWTKNDSTHDGLYLGNKDQATGGNTDITLDNFAIRGAGSGEPEGLNSTHDYPRVPGIRFRLVNRLAITRMEISYVPGISLLNQGTSNGLIKGNYVHHAGRDGINTGWHQRGSDHVLVSYNRIEKVGDDAVALLGANGSHFGQDQWSHDLAAVGNIVKGWTTNVNGLALGRGIAVISVKNAEVIKNSLEFTESHGVLVAPAVDPVTSTAYRSTDIRLADNVVSNAGQLGSGNGVTVKRAERITSQNTTIINPQSKAWAVFDCTACDLR